MFIFLKLVKWTIKIFFVNSDFSHFLPYWITPSQNLLDDCESTKVSKKFLQFLHDKHSYIPYWLNTNFEIAFKIHFKSKKKCLPPWGNLLVTWWDLMLNCRRWAFRSEMCQLICQWARFWSDRLIVNSFALLFCARICFHFFLGIRFCLERPESNCGNFDLLSD